MGMEGVPEWLDYVAFVLVAVGAINWGLVGAIDFNIVAELANAVGVEMLETAVYIIVGLAGLSDLLGVTGGYGLLAE